MDLIALSGPPCSGKSSVARELEKRGYLFIDFCDIIKVEAARALTYLGVPTTVEQVRSNKDKYRAFLQELGIQIGFNDNPRFVLQALEAWRGQNAVFDNVRTPEQYRVLEPYGFRLVRLDAPFEVRARRAAEKYGTSEEEFLEQGMHPIERGQALVPVVALDARIPPDLLATLLMDIDVQEAA